jgi:hypothetical protein
MILARALAAWLLVAVPALSAQDTDAAFIKASYTKW